MALFGKPLVLQGLLSRWFRMTSGRHLLASPDTSAGGALPQMAPAACPSSSQPCVTLIYNTELESFNSICITV